MRLPLTGCGKQTFKHIEDIWASAGPFDAVIAHSQVCALRWSHAERANRHAPARAYTRAHTQQSPEGSISTSNPESYTLNTKPQGAILTSVLLAKALDPRSASSFRPPKSVRPELN